MPSGIYQIVNTINHKIYIGSAVNLANRKSQHWSRLSKNVHRNPHLKNSWNKYGADVFEFEILITCPRDLLLFYEQQFLDLGKPEYNICKKADSPLGRKLSEEHRAKISKSLLGNTHTLGHKHTEKTRAKMREAAKHKPPVSEETRRKIGISKLGNTNMLGKHHTEKTRRIMSEKHRGEKSSNVKLTEEDVITIRRLYATTAITQKQLAIQYGMTRRAIGDITQGRNWKHLPVYSNKDKPKC